MKTLTLKEPTVRWATKIIPPNYSSWQTIELSYLCASHVIEKDIPGCFIETGIAAGNNFAAMLAAGRKGHGFDSFEGIPWAGEKDKDQPGIGAKDESKHGLLETSGVSSHGIMEVRRNLKNWLIEEERYTLHAGWFQDTVPLFKGEISVLRMDGDLYESTKVCLEHLYPQLVEYGILIIDDYELPGCRLAVQEYFRKIGKYPKLVYRNGPAYMQKVPS